MGPKYRAPCYEAQDPDRACKICISGYRFDATGTFKNKLIQKHPL